MSQKYMNIDICSSNENIPDENDTPVFYSFSQSSTPSIHSTDEYITIDIENANNMNINNILEETNLIKYTDDHFINKLNESLEKIREIHKIDIEKTKLIDRNIEEDIDSNSPIMLSNNNSDNDDDDEYDEEYPHNDKIVYDNSHKSIRFNRLTFKQVSDSLDKYYENDDKYSNELDILITFLNGQKNIFVKSKNITQTKLHVLMIPALVGTCIITIFAPILRDYEWSGFFISGLNVFTALFYSMVHYLKLESSLEMYTFLSNQYDKLESTLQMTSNKISFLQKTTDKNTLVLDKMKEIEKNLKDMKENSNIMLPEEVKIAFPIICHIPIFSFIKRIETYKKNLIMKFADVKNEIRYIHWKWGNKIEQRERKRLEFLYEIKEKIKEELVHYKNAYDSIDEIFIREIKRAEKMSLWNIYTKKKKKKQVFTNMNPVVEKYLTIIFADD